jgi:hypothetical protein
VWTVNEGIPRGLSFPKPTDGAFVGSPWRMASVLWLSVPTYHGPVLIRGRQLDGPHAIGFGTGARPQRELRLPPGAWDEASSPLTIWHFTVHPQPGWRIAISQTRVRSSGCYGYQVDGTSFSYAIIFAAVVQWD